MPPVETEASMYSKHGENGISMAINCFQGFQLLGCRAKFSVYVFGGRGATTSWGLGLESGMAGLGRQAI